MATTTGYRGYTFSIVTSQLGWRLSIFAPGGSAAFMESVNTSDQRGLDRIIAEARLIVDNAIDRVRRRQP